MDTRIKPYLTVQHGEAIEKAGNACTVLDGDIPVVVGGIFKFWQNRGEAWLIFGKVKTQDFITIFKMVQRFISMSPLRRIEMVIDHDFPQGHRWAKLLGFEKEAECLRSYLPDGRDVSLYALVRN